MVFTEKVNRLEYITRHGFDNTVEEKKELMNFFSELERKSAALEAQNAELIAALEKMQYRLASKGDVDGAGIIAKVLAKAAK